MLADKTPNQRWLRKCIQNVFTWQRKVDRSVLPGVHPCGELSIDIAPPLNKPFMQQQFPIITTQDWPINEANCHLKQKSLPIYMIPLLHSGDWKGRGWWRENGGGGEKCWTRTLGKEQRLAHHLEGSIWYVTSGNRRSACWEVKTHSPSQSLQS